jgi:hypothetical protein
LLQRESGLKPESDLPWRPEAMYIKESVRIYRLHLANLERIVNVSNIQLVQPNEKIKKKKVSTSKKKKGPEQSARDMVARSNNTVEARFLLTAYTLTGGVTDESVNEQHASNE